MDIPIILGGEAISSLELKIVNLNEQLIHLNYELTNELKKDPEHRDEMKISQLRTEIQEANNSLSSNERRLVEVRNTGFVTGMDEFKNTLYVLLKNHRGLFVQSNRVGTTLDVHVQEPDYIRDAIRVCVEQIPNCTLSTCDVTFNGRHVEVFMICQYHGDIVNFKFEYDNEV